jgi:uncharacterized protein YkwD
MPEPCEACGRTTSARCRYCREPVCADHERPSRHGCTGPSYAPPPTAPEDAGERDPLRTALVVLFGVLLLSVVVVGALSLTPAGSTAPERLNETRVERLVHQYVDEERRGRAVGGVTWNESLAAVARDHSAHMAANDYVGHYRDGPLFERYAEHGLSCPGGENVYAVGALGLTTDERTVARRAIESWLDSPGHRETLLKERFTRHGVGVVVDEEAGEPTTVYVTEEYC